MEIFYQLLDSYTRIKKRKFRVLREAAAGSVAKGPPPGWEQAVAAAGAFLDSALTSPTGVTAPDGKTTATVKDPEFKVVNVGGGVMGNRQTDFFLGQGGWAQKKNGTPLANSGPNSQGKALVDLFLTGEQDQQTQQTQQVAPVSTAKLPGQHIAVNYSELEQSFINLDKVARKLHQKVLESDEFKKFEEKDQETAEKLRDEDYFASYFAGAKNQALESKIAKAKGIAFDEKGLIRLVGDEDPLLRQTVIDTVKNLEEAFNLLKKDELDTNDTNRLKNLLFLSKNKIAVRSKGDDINKGLTIGDNKGVLGLVMRAMTPEDFVFNKYKKGTDDSAFRGLNLEEVLVPLSMHANCKRRKEANLNDAITDSYCNGAKEAWGEFRNQIEDMIKVHGEWLPFFENGDLATLSEDAEMFDQLSQLLGDKFEPLMKGLLSVSNDSIAKRRPDFIVRVGEKTGIGLKDDVQEIWLKDKDGECSKAVDGMTRQGLEGFEATIMDAREAFKSSPSQFKIAQQMQSDLSKAGSTVCVAGVSIKNYLSLAKKNPKFGENFLGRIGNLFECVGGGSCDPKDKKDQEMLTEFLNKLTDQLGGDGLSDKQLKENREAFFADVRKYEEGNKNIAHQINLLEFDVNAVDSETGKLTKTNTVKTSVESIINSLKEANVLDTQLDTETLVGSTLMKLEDLDLNDEKDARKAKIAMMSHLVNTKRARDLKKEQEEEGMPSMELLGQRIGPATKHMLASAWAIGGSNNDYALFDTRGLLEGTTHTAYQNDYLKEMIAGVKDNTWEIVTKGATVTIRDKSNHKKAAKMSNQNRTRGGGGLDSIQAEFSITDDFLDPEGHPQEPQPENNSIQSFLDNQKVLLEELLAAMK